MRFKTSITRIEEGKEIIRGHELRDLVRENNFSESIYLILKGKLPNKQEARMFDAILTSVIDHGPGVASAIAARVSASAKNSMHTSLAAGILSFGDRHGVASGAAMKFFYDHIKDSDLEATLKSMKEKKEYVPGLGHKLFQKEDPRSTTLFEIAKETGIFGSYCVFALAVSEISNRLSSKMLPLNVDGAIAAILCDMGFDYRLGKGIFMIGRVPGLIAHIYEETLNDEGIRRIPEEQIDYTD
ncbi:MAG: citryl-CoA lyase [Candidatus Magasanikbacteria bacterium]|nr:citryl-CoA lyase [Candidatus Magasanikbacteria bacterium]